MRKANISLQANHEQRKLIARASSLLGQRQTNFILDASFEFAQSVVLDQVLFTASAEKFEQFEALLDAPVAANAGLKRLMAVQPPWPFLPVL